MTLGSDALQIYFKPKSKITQNQVYLKVIENREGDCETELCKLSDYTN